VVVRVRRQAGRQVDAPAIEELAAGRDRDEHRRVAVLDDADGRGSPCTSFRLAFLQGLPLSRGAGYQNRRFGCSVSRALIDYSINHLNTTLVSTPHRRFKDTLYEHFARVGKALAAPKRLELLDLLSQSPRTVEAVAEHAALSVANASRHLQVLRAARLVEAEKRGLYVEYRLADDAVADLMLRLRTLAEARLAEIERVTRVYFEERGEMEAVRGDDLLRRVKNGEVTVLDVRPVEEYRAAHIPGAISIPVSELKARLKELPKRREIAAYCRGPYCVMAVDAVELLRKHGFKAHRMEQGVLDWRARGFRLESAPQGANA
jgi:rhodanese-related sulfurtransferase/DNA-binding transcriptional ArsR family regulator